MSSGVALPVVLNLALGDDVGDMDGLTVVHDGVKVDTFRAMCPKAVSFVR